MSLLEQVNDLLRQGYDIGEVSIKLGKSREWARRKLSDQGYKYDRKLKQYIPKGNTEPKQEQLNILDTVDKPGVTKVVTDSLSREKVTKHKQQQELAFSSSDIDILYKLIQEYRLVHTIKADSSSTDTLQNRNVRVYENHYKNFANWCKKNNITQADALKKAIDLLMNNNE